MTAAYLLLLYDQALFEEFPLVPLGQPIVCRAMCFNENQTCRWQLHMSQSHRSCH